MSRTSLLKTVSDVVSETPSAAAVSDFLAWILGRAATEIRPSLMRFRYRSEVGINSLDDLMMDAVADLFERDDKGRFVRLRAFYGPSMQLASLSETELEKLTVQFVKRTVGDAVFRLYRSVDPELARIIRNLKRCLRRRPDMEVYSASGRMWVHPTEEPRRSGEAWDIERVSALLAVGYQGHYGLEWVADALTTMLRDESGFENRVGLTTLALAYRAAMVALEEEEPAGADPYASTTMEEEDARVLIDEAIARSVRPAAHRYLEKGKLASFEAKGLQRGIRTKLLSCVHSRREEETFYSALAISLPQLNRERYRMHYRNTFEYFHKQAISALQDVVEEEQWIS